MQKIIPVSLLLILFFSCQSTIQEKIEEVHPNNQPKVVNYLQKINGEEVIVEQKQFYPNGQLKIVGKYEKGQRNGVWKAYFENGKLQSEGQFLNGKRTGLAKVYYANGNLRYEGEYLNNKETGHWNFFNKAGKLVQEKDF